MQPKLSAKLNYTQETFEFVDTFGNYILKPPNLLYKDVCENEHLTMHLASSIGIEVPTNGLVRNSDGSLTYFIRRFDRYEKNKKRLVEDFAQLSGRLRETKYDSSMEQVVKVIAEHCTFPYREYEKLLRLTLFSFLIGNEDMHLKNFSLLVKDGTVSLSPAYDLLSTTIILKEATEELALPLNGKKRNLTKNDLLKYFATSRLQLTDRIVDKMITEIKSAQPYWQKTINKSVLPEEKKQQYLGLLSARAERLEI